jgi:hypothetical protein
MASLPDESVEGLLVTFDALAGVSDEGLRPAAAECAASGAGTRARPTRLLPERLPESGRYRSPATLFLPADDSLACTLDADSLHHARQALAEGAHFEIGDDIAGESAGQILGHEGLIAGLGTCHADDPPGSNGPDSERRVAIVRAQPAMDGEAPANQRRVALTTRRAGEGRGKEQRKK